MYQIKTETLKDGSKKKIHWQEFLKMKLQERLKAKQLVVFKEINQGEIKNLDKVFSNNK